MGLIRTEGSDLVFENPQQIDSGNYTFIVNNTAGERRQNVWVIVSGKRTGVHSFIRLLRVIRRIYGFQPLNSCCHIITGMCPSLRHCKVQLKAFQGRL